MTEPMPFTFKKLTIPELILVEAKSFSDERGFFLESFKESTFIENGKTSKLSQLKQDPFNKAHD